MLLAETDYGPFASVVGYVTTGIAAVVAITLAALGPMGRLRSPDEDLPRTAQFGAAMMGFVGMVGVFLLATPNNRIYVFMFAAICALAWMLVFSRYSGLIGKHRYDKVVANADGKTTTTYKIIGGGEDELLPNAASLKQSGKTTQKILEGAAYDPDALWSRDARMKVKTRLMHLFLMMIVSGTLGATAAGFAVQVTLTNKPAAGFLHKADAPGLTNTPSTSK